MFALLKQANVHLLQRMVGVAEQEHANLKPRKNLEHITNLTSCFKCLLHIQLTKILFLTLKDNFLQGVECGTREDCSP